MLASILGHDARLRAMTAYVEEAAKRVFGVPKFCTFADGLSALFAYLPGAPVTRIQHSRTIQMPLFPFDSS